MSSSNRNNGKANSQVGLVFLSQEENTVLAFKCRTASLNHHRYPDSPWAEKGKVWYKGDSCASS
jgi:hypothetical protein